MIAEIKSLMTKRLDLCGLMVVLLIIILLAAHQQAQANSDNLGGDIATNKVTLMEDRRD